MIVKIEGYFFRLGVFHTKYTVIFEKWKKGGREYYIKFTEEDVAKYRGGISYKINNIVIGAKILFEA